MATSMHAIQGVSFVIACLKRIKIVKEIFALEIE